MFHFLFRVDWKEFCCGRTHLSNQLTQALQEAPVVPSHPSLLSVLEALHKEEKRGHDTAHDANNVNATTAQPFWTIFNVKMFILLCHYPKRLVSFSSMADGF